MITPDQLDTARYLAETVQNILLRNIEKEIDSIKTQLQALGVTAD